MSAPTDCDRVAVASSGVDFLLTYRCAGAGLWATRVQPGGSAGLPFQLRPAASAPDLPRPVWAGARWAVSYAETVGGVAVVSALRVEVDGGLPDPNGVVISIDQARAPRLFLGNDGDLWYLWSLGAPPNEVLMAQRMNDNLQLIGIPFPIALSAPAGGVGVLGSPDSAQVLVAWSTRGDAGDLDLFARRMHFDGTPIGEAFVVSADPGRSESSLGIASAAPGEVVVVYQALDTDAGSWVQRVHARMITFDAGPAAGVGGGAGGGSGAGGGGGGTGGTGGSSATGGGSGVGGGLAAPLTLRVGCDCQAAGALPCLWLAALWWARRRRR